MVVDNAIKVLGVHMFSYKIDQIAVSFAENKAEIKNTFYSLLDSKKNKISFINPEIFMQQRKDSELHNYFESCKYNFVDGIGLLYAINQKFKTHYDSSFRCPGTDFFEYLPEDKKIRIFFYGSKLENVIKAKELIESKYENITIADYFDGYSSIREEDLIAKINAAEVDILIVCLGCPKQEFWIKKNFDKLNVKIVFGNGGSIDFWSGAVKRAPDFFINHGLEFIYRLFQNFTFKRIKRQLKLFNFFFSYKLGKYEIEESRE